MSRRAHVPAFPRPHSWDEAAHSGMTESDLAQPFAAHDGMTLREYAAVAAMQGLLANPEVSGATVHDIARAAVEQADALLAKLVAP